MVVKPADPHALNEAIARVRDGDLEAFRQVVEIADTPLRLVVAAIVMESSQVEDVVQNAFVTAYRKLDEYRPDTNALAWMKAIARNLALNERRRSCREMRRLHDQRAEVWETIEAELVVQAYDSDPALLAALRQCLDRLRGTARQVVDAFYWGDATPQAIADLHGKTTGWVRVVLHRARAFIGDCLGREADER